MHFGGLYVILQTAKLRRNWMRFEALVVCEQDFTFYKSGLPRKVGWHYQTPQRPKFNWMKKTLPRMAHNLGSPQTRYLPFSIHLAKKGIWPLSKRGPFISLALSLNAHFIIWAAERSFEFLCLPSAQSQIQRQMFSIHSIFSVLLESWNISCTSVNRTSGYILAMERWYTQCRRKTK